MARSGPLPSPFAPRSRNAQEVVRKNGSGSTGRRVSPVFRDRWPACVDLPGAGPDNVSMHIRILFLGEFGVRFGREHALDCTGPLPVAELRRRICEQVEGAATVMTRPDTRLVIDQAIAPDTAFAGPGQEVAILPIYSGG